MGTRQGTLYVEYHKNYNTANYSFIDKNLLQNWIAVEKKGPGRE